MQKTSNAEISCGVVTLHLSDVQIHNLSITFVAEPGNTEVFSSHSFIRTPRSVKFRHPLFTVDSP